MCMPFYFPICPSLSPSLPLSPPPPLSLLLSLPIPPSLSPPSPLSLLHPQFAFTCFSYHHGNICFTTFEIYAMILPVLIFLTYMPSFKWLAYAAYVGTVFLTIAMIVSHG